MKDKNNFAMLAILLSTILWGMTFAFIKDAIATLPPLNFLFWRFGIASAILFILFFKKIKLNKETLWYGFFLGIFLLGTVGFQTIGLLYTTASTASFITGLSVIMVALSEPVMNQYWPSKYLMFSCLLALSGVGIITLGDGIAINIGDVWVFLCAVSFAIFIVLAGKASHIHQPLTLTFLQSLFVCISAGGLGAVLGDITLPSETNVWIAIIFCSLFASILAFFLQLNYQKYVSASKVAIIYSLEPVFATLTAALYLGERLAFPFYIGAAMIFIAILLSEKKAKHKIIPQE